MKYRSVGKSGLKISEVALGSWVADLKGTTAEDVAKETVKLAYDSGVNFFDCADAYSGGAAERFLGKTLKQYPRKELVISSKVYFPTGEGVNDRGLSRKHIFESIDQTLKNMQTDYLDMYFCHRFDETTDLTETLRAMSDLVAQGKVLYYGVSEEWGSARLEEAQRIIDRYNLYPITVVQPQYNLNDRYIEHEIMGTCRKLGIGITTFSPLAQGLLTDRYLNGIPADSRVAHDPRFLHADDVTRPAQRRGENPGAELLGQPRQGARAAAQGGRRARHEPAGAFHGMDPAAPGDQLCDRRRLQAQPAGEQHEGRRL